MGNTNGNRGSYVNSINHLLDGTIIDIFKTGNKDETIDENEITALIEEKMEN